MKIFEIVNNNPVVTTECLLIPEFAKLWQRDKSKTKDTAYSELQYVYFSSDYKSLYLAWDKETREERLVEDFIKKKGWTPDKEILAAIKKYKEFQNTPTMRFLESNQNAMESFTKYYNDIDWDELDASGKRPKYDITKVTTSIKQAGGIIDNIEKLKDKVAKEQNLNEVKARGNSIGGLLEFDR